MTTTIRKDSTRNNNEKQNSHTEKPTSPLEAALYYFNHGCFVIPCCTMSPAGQCTWPHHKHEDPKSVGKQPIVGNDWQNLRLTREGIDWWWTEHPTANVGVQLEPSHLLLIDPDSSAAIEEASRKGLPPGPQVRTGNGEHHYFRNRKGIIGATTRQGESGRIDVLSQGIAVGFGSTHRNGKRYELLVSWEDWDLEDPPLWAEELLLAAIKKRSAAAEIPTDLPPVDLDSLDVSALIKHVILTGKAPPHTESYPSRSEALWAVLMALVEADHSNITMASILLDPRYKISDKPRKQGRKWTAKEIARARAKAATNGAEKHTTGEEEPRMERTAADEEGRGKEGNTKSEEECGKEGRTGFDTYNGATLRNKDFPPLQEAIPDLLPIGLTVLAGPPKLGKSFMVLNIACAIASGGKAFSRFDVQAGACLYLALEDSQRRIQNRLLAVLGDYEEWPDHLPDFIHTASLSGAGLEADLIGWITAHPTARLVIVDTLAKVKPPRQRGQDPYQEDYRISARLQQLALSHGIALVLVHHTKKGPEEDFLSAVSGTHGVTGAADAVWVLKRKRGQLDGTLSVTGRDIEERDLAVKMIDSDWLCLGDATEVRRSESRKKILDALAHGPLTPAEIAVRTGIKRGTVRKLLTKMLDQGDVAKSAEKYSLCTNPR